MPNATSAEKWIIVCLFNSDFNKKLAAHIAGVGLRHVQKIEKLHRDFLEQIKSAARHRVS